MPESVNRRGSSGPTMGAIAGLSGLVAIGRKGTRERLGEAMASGVMAVAEIHSNERGSLTAEWVFSRGRRGHGSRLAWIRGAARPRVVPQLLLRRWPEPRG